MTISDKYIRFASSVYSFAAGLGISMVVGSIIKQFVQPKNMFDKIMLFAGGAALTGYISDKISGSAQDKAYKAIASANETVQKLTQE